MAAATSSARTSTARCSAASPAPSAWAVSATVPLRRKPNSPKIQSTTSADMATPPSRCASPSRPITAVETIPSSGVVRLASIAGPAIWKTRAWVMSNGPGEVVSMVAAATTLPPAPGSPPARSVDHPHDDPDRDDDYRAEQEIAPDPADGVEAHVPDAADEPLQAVEDVERVETQRRQHHADQDRDQDQLDDDRKRGSAEGPARTTTIGHQTLLDEWVVRDPECGSIVLPFSEPA